ncbi:MAG TPA: ribosome-associated translation inhibitor RaiA [Spirochaetia bacterium]|nr:ribosome-associated translation inhibitor RaiA [Spirochaetia bacterium]
MRIEIKGVHLDVTEEMKEHVDKKIQKLSFAHDMIMDFLLTLTKEKSSYKIEVNLNFRWGSSAHLSVDSFDFFKGIDTLMDKLEIKVTKEKEKIQEH